MQIHIVRLSPWGEIEVQKQQQEYCRSEIIVFRLSLHMRFRRYHPGTVPVNSVEAQISISRSGGGSHLHFSDRNSIINLGLEV